MLICPVCQSALSEQPGALKCSNGHSFDRARQGYVNLLPVQHKKSRDPGDNAAMVEARRRFLDAGHYAPIAQQLATYVAAEQPQAWLDIGCGEGYYSAQIAQALPKAQGFALDISREAVRRACKRAPEMTWMVASMARVPLAEQSCNVLTSVFSPLDWNEALRLLPAGGVLLRVGPCSEHLLQMRERLYDQVRDYDDEKHLSEVPSGFSHTRTERLGFELALDLPQERADLLAMTPHGWRANSERRQAVIDTALNVQVAVRYDWFVRQP